MAFGKGRSVPLKTFQMTNGEKTVTADRNCEKLLKKKGFKRVGAVDPTPEKEPENSGGEINLAEMNEEALTAFVEDNDLDIDLNDYESIDDKREAVAEAYEDEEED